MVREPLVEYTRLITCVRCKAPNLHWINVQELSKGVVVANRWRLFDINENTHCCTRLKYI